MTNIDCPNCGKEMKNKSFEYYGFGSWDMDYPDELHEEYYCKLCKIKFANGEWTLPKNIERPSERQVNCVNVINNILHTDFTPLIKSKTSQFIKDNIQKSKDISLYNKEHKYDWMEPDDVSYMNDAWCEHY